MMNHKDKSTLKRLYVDEGYSLTNIGDMFGVDFRLIHYYMKKYGIPRREQSHGISPANRNTCILSKVGKEFIYGELLGDMSISDWSRFAANISYGSKYREYAEWLDEQLSSFGIMRAGDINKRVFKIWGKEHDHYRYKSLRYPVLLEIREMFYPSGKKIIPDIDFTPLVLRQWYIGDGCLSHKKKIGARPNIYLCTNGFTAGDVESAVEQLNAIGFKSNRLKARNMIGISTYSVTDFLDYIGPCPVECYSYKWATKNRKGQLEMPLKN